MPIYQKFLKSIRKKLKIILMGTIVRVSRKVKFLDSVFKESRGIGWIAPLETQVKYLVGGHQENFTLFDIGANKGEYSLIVQKLFPKGIIYSFEPSKKTYDKLLQNVNGQSQIIPLQIGFGEERRQTHLYSDKDGSELASLYKREFQNSDTKFDRIEPINIETLDDWTLQNKVTPDLIKIDVEGAELLVLRGAINVLKEVKGVQFEFGGTALDAKKYFRDYWDFFSRINFILYRYTPFGLLRIENWSEKEEVFEHMNYLAVPFKNCKHGML